MDKETEAHRICEPQDNCRLRALTHLMRGITAYVASNILKQIGDLDETMELKMIIKVGKKR